MRNYLGKYLSKVTFNKSEPPTAGVRSHDILFLQLVFGYRRHYQKPSSMNHSLQLHG